MSCRVWIKIPAAESLFVLGTHLPGFRFGYQSFSFSPGPKSELSKSQLSGGAGLGLSGVTGSSTKRDMEEPGLLNWNVRGFFLVSFWLVSKIPMGGPLNNNNTQIVRSSEKDLVNKVHSRVFRTIHFVIVKEELTGGGSFFLPVSF